MDNKDCKFSYTSGSEKNNKGKFLKFSEQVIEDDAGKKFQQTMALVKTFDGNIIQVEPQCIQITEDDLI